MTLPLAAEAVGDLAQAEASGEASTALGSARSRSLTERTGVKPTRPQVHQPRATTPPAPARRGGSRPTTTRPNTPRRPRSAAPGGFTAPKTRGGAGAHRAVIAEFILCVVLIGMGPVLTRKPGSNHLYAANDFVRLTATCLLFFTLALLANSPRSARFAAAFGGLVTLGVAFNARQSLLAIGSVFGGGSWVVGRSTDFTTTAPATGGGSGATTATGTPGGAQATGVTQTP